MAQTLYPGLLQRGKATGKLWGILGAWGKLLMVDVRTRWKVARNLPHNEERTAVKEFRRAREKCLGGFQCQGKGVQQSAVGKERLASGCTRTGNKGRNNLGCPFLAGRRERHHYAAGATSRRTRTP